MKKQKGLGLIGVLLIIGTLLPTAGGVVVWREKASPTLIPTPTPKPTTTTSPNSTQPTGVPISPVTTQFEEGVKSKGKISSHLLTLYNEYVAFQGKNTGEEFKPTYSLLRIYGDKVLVDAVASEDVSVLQADLQRLGMTHSTAFGRMVSGYLPILSIDDLSTLDSLQFIRASSMTTQGETNGD